MRSPTQAGQQVIDWLEANGRSREWLADELGVSRESLWRWIIGERTPRIEHCVAIEQITGVPVASWIKEPSTVAAVEEA